LDKKTKKERKKERKNMSLIKLKSRALLNGKDNYYQIIMDLALCFNEIKRGK